MSSRPTTATGRFGKPHEQRQQSRLRTRAAQTPPSWREFRNGPAPAHRPGSPTAGGHRAELGGLPAMGRLTAARAAGVLVFNQAKIRSLHLAFAVLLAFRLSGAPQYGDHRRSAQRPDAGGDSGPLRGLSVDLLRLGKRPHRRPTRAEVAAAAVGVRRCCSKLRGGCWACRWCCWR